MPANTDRRSCCPVACTLDLIGDKWTLDDHRPDKVGQYRMIVKLVIDSARTGDASIFRVSGWRVAVIVSSQLAA